MNFSISTTRQKNIGNGYWRKSMHRFDKKNQTLKLYWSKCAGGKNLGDIVGSYILEQYGYQIEWTNYDTADTICVGSVAHMAIDGCRIMGAGISSRTARVNSNANYIWVRGPLTRRRVLEIGGLCPEIYGDPALLLPRFIKPLDNKKHKIAILSHYIDYRTIQQQYPQYHIINMQTENMIKAIEEITECVTVVSSSLHGIIIANAYGIPAAWAKFNTLTGDNVKFYDYANSGNVEITDSTVESPKFICPKIDTDHIHSILESGSFK
jgi:hypothetical protein